MKELPPIPEHSSRFESTGELAAEAANEYGGEPDGFQITEPYETMIVPGEYGGEPGGSELPLTEIPAEAPEVYLNFNPAEVAEDLPDAAPHGERIDPGRNAASGLFPGEAGNEKPTPSREYIDRAIARALKKFGMENDEE